MRPSGIHAESFLAIHQADSSRIRLVSGATMTSRLV